MTIRVCHNTFNRITHAIWKVVVIIFKVSIISLLPLGVVAFLVLDSSFIGVGIVGAIVGFSVLLFVLLVPDLNDEPNCFQRLNRKFKLFGWREDC